MQRRDCLRGFAVLAALGLVAGLPNAVGAEPSAIHRVRDLRHDAWLDSAELFERLARAPSIVIGERHDNPEHHRLERWLIACLAERSMLGGVAMEMLDTRQQMRLARISHQRLLQMNDAELRHAFDWQGRGWDWSAYGPILRLTLSLGLPLGAANLPHERIAEIVSAGRVPDLPPAVARAQRRALIEGHCGLLPESILDGMLAAQVARDRVMAEALAELPPSALLICGSGHARRDIGVALHAEEKPLCVGLVEVGHDQNWRDALPASVDAGPPFDLAWFTAPAAERGDVCAALRKRFS
ncbi:Uncharacterized iron-regulated protein [Modicisalibacter muralis]|uniref:Uncharacterized iron-regulated protein n=1 Tax=Modicisalibacter muralis TaxID=119000 RepID=A0A1G9NEF2_9GAMM|nr:ChaN family lipoprotein [Halomonas muralis]SDL84850.1 Uncharacterized iron-regulated protein [Halomonas muralis]